MESSGAPSISWDNWLRLFKFIVTASGLDTATEKLKQVVLYGSLSANAACIASYFTDVNIMYDDSITRLTELLGENQSVIYARTKFHPQSQQAGENILDRAQATGKLLQVGCCLA